MSLRFSQFAPEIDAFLAAQVPALLLQLNLLSKAPLTAGDLQSLNLALKAAQGPTRLRSSLHSQIAWAGTKSLVTSVHIQPCGCRRVRQ